MPTQPSTSVDSQPQIENSTDIYWKISTHEWTALLKPVLFKGQLSLQIPPPPTPRVTIQRPHTEQAEPCWLWEILVKRKMSCMTVLVLWALNLRGEPYDDSWEHSRVKVNPTKTNKEPHPIESSQILHLLLFLADHIICLIGIFR